MRFGRTKSVQNINTTMGSAGYLNRHNQRKNTYRVDFNKQFWLKLHSDFKFFRNKIRWHAKYLLLTSKVLKVFDILYYYLLNLELHQAVQIHMCPTKRKWVLFPWFNAAVHKWESSFQLLRVISIFFFCYQATGITVSALQFWHIT